MYIFVVWLFGFGEPVLSFVTNCHFKIVVIVLKVALGLFNRFRIDIAIFRLVEAFFGGIKRTNNDRKAKTENCKNQKTVGRYTWNIRFETFVSFTDVIFRTLDIDIFENFYLTD